MSAVGVEAAYEDCRRITSGAGSSFYAGMRLLPAERRRAIYVVYALARRIDDIADGDLPDDEKVARLDAVRSQLASPVPADDPVFVALADAAQRYPIPLAAFLDLIEGAEADVRGVHHETFAELEYYCRCVAGSIGRLALGVFETSDRPRAGRLADDLGVAMQLGNILRDLRQDLRRGRSYLPAEDLRRFGCSVAGDELEGDAELLVAFEAERALGWLERGLRLIPLLDRRSGLAVSAMTCSYRRLIERVAAEPARALGGRAALRSWEKKAVLVRSVLGAAA